MKVHWRSLIWKTLLWIGGWTLVALFFASSAYFSQRRMSSGAGSFLDAFKQSLIQWYAWGALSLLIIRADRWIPKDFSLMRRLAIHLPLSVFFTVAHLLLMQAERTLMDDPRNGWQMPAPILSFANLLSLLGGAFQWSYVIYWLIAGGWLAWDYHRESQARKLETAQLEQLLTQSRLLHLKSQLHPHFLFNALNTISAFVEQDPRGARMMIEHLGDLLRFSLDHSETQETTLEEELKVLDHYLAIQRVRFDESLKIRREIATETLSAKVPSLILQPLVENVIQHVVAQQVKPVSLTIQASKKGKDLMLGVHDDGPGLPPNWRLHEHAGVGLANTRQRLEQLYPGKHRFTVQNGAIGAQAEITLPFRS